MKIYFGSEECLAQSRSAASRNQKILQKETKQTKTGENFAKNAVVFGRVCAWIIFQVKEAVEGRHCGEKWKGFIVRT
jgi:hypothetical protein